MKLDKFGNFYGLWPVGIGLLRVLELVLCSVAAIGNAVFIYLFRSNFNGLLTLQGCVPVLSFPLSPTLFLSGSHRVLSSAFDTSHLVRSCQIFVCALDAILALLFMAMSSGRAAGQELLSLSPTLHPSPALHLCVLSMAIRTGAAAAAFDMRLRCGPRKSFHFNFFIFFFAFHFFDFHFSVFGFSFFHFFIFFVAFSLLSNWQLQNRKRGCQGGGGRGAAEVNPMRPQKQI